jgi:hypothetical protein
MWQSLAAGLHVLFALTVLGQEPFEERHIESVCGLTANLQNEE